MEKVLVKIAEKIIEQISPGMRDEITAGVKRLEVKAKETKDNPWDDIFVMILKAALGIE